MSDLVSQLHISYIERSKTKKICADVVSMMNILYYASYETVNF